MGKKIHWLSWDKLARAKGDGIMEFRGISNFNVSLPRKHYWRLLTGEDSLLAKVMKGRYYPQNSISDASPGYNPSYAWRRILGARDAVESGPIWRIGNGEKVRFEGITGYRTSRGLNLSKLLLTLIWKGKLASL